MAQNQKRRRWASRALTLPSKAMALATTYEITKAITIIETAKITSEVWVLEKGQDGFSTIKRASEEIIVTNLVAEGLPLGGLWYSEYLDGR